MTTKNVICNGQPVTFVKNNTCVPGLCRIAWDYFQLQQNCLYDV